MNITLEKNGALEAIIAIEIAKDDYAENVEKTLLSYKKNANIPGFRKGAVPMSLVKKQYEKAIKAEEIDKLLQKSLNDYITTEKLDILGQPLPTFDDDFSWDNDTYNFSFEIGLAPEFSVNLDTNKQVTQYTIIADKDAIDHQVAHVAKMYGKLVPKTEVSANDDELYGTFTNAEYGIENTTSIALSVFKNKEVVQQFMGKTEGDVVTIPTKGLFDDDHKLMEYLKVEHDHVHGLDTTVDFKILSISAVEKAELNQELFDKLFGEGVITSEDELRDKLKTELEQHYNPQATQKLINDVNDYLVANTSFDLPETFLKKWLVTAGETTLTPEQADEEYTRSEDSLRYQLIESQIIKQNNVTIEFEDLKEYTGKTIRKQLAQFGQYHPTDEEIEQIIARVLSNKEEVRRITDEILTEKIIALYNEKANVKSETVTYPEFLNIYYGDKK